MPPELQRTATEEHQFPVESFMEAAEHLRRPFARNAVKFKIVGGLNVAAYIDARSVEERLNHVVPHLWHDDYEQINPKAMWCHLTVDGITRHNIGEGGTLKALRSDSLKRVAVSFGVGQSLYAIPSVRIDQAFTEKQGKATIITPDGIAHLRGRYDGWLENGGTDRFGEILDHGDSEDAVGDVEAEEGAESGGQDLPDEPQPLMDPAALALVERAEELQKNVPATSMPPAQFKRQLESAKSSMPDLEKLVAALEEMQQ